MGWPVIGAYRLRAQGMTANQLGCLSGSVRGGIDGNTKAKGMPSYRHWRDLTKPLF